MTLILVAGEAPSLKILKLPAVKNWQSLAVILQALPNPLAPYISLPAPPGELF